MRIRENDPGKSSRNEKALRVRLPRKRQSRIRLTDWERYLDEEDWNRLRALKPVPLGWKRPRPPLLLPKVETSPKLFYFTSKQAAEFLGQTVSTLSSWRKKRTGPEFTSVESATTWLAYWIG